MNGIVYEIFNQLYHSYFQCCKIRLFEPVEYILFI